jgi:hypothetical protein
MNRRADAGAIVNRLKSSTSGGKKDSHHSGWLVVSSAQDFMPWVNKHFTGVSIATPSKTPLKTPSKTAKKYNIEFGIAMIDESHEEYFKQTGRGKVLYEMPSANQPFLWGYSGTPFSQTPRGLEGVLWAIEKHVPSPSKGVSGWASHPVLYQFMWERLDHICKAFDTQVKSKTPDNAKVDDILAQFVPFLQNFVIRRDANTKWFGHRLIKLKSHHHQDIQLDNIGITTDEFTLEVEEVEAEFKVEKDNALLELQQKWDKFPERRRALNRPEQLAFNTLCRLQWRSRILATLPYAEKLLHAEDPKHKIDLSLAETLEFFRRPGDKIKENPYYTHAKAIAEGSPKLIHVYNLIKALGKGTDYQGEEQKLIIMSTFPQVVFAMFMASITQSNLIIQH